MTVSTDQYIILASYCGARDKEKECRNTTYEGETLWISWACLDQELVAPAVESFETLGVVHIVDQDTTIGSTVEGDSQRLEPFLACSIPDLTHPSQLLPLISIVLVSNALPALSPVGRRRELPL